MSAAAVLLWAVAVMAALGSFAALFRRDLGAWRRFTAAEAVSGLAASALDDDALTGTAFALILAVLLWDWWNRRGKRAAKALGEKSRALVDGLVEAMREAGAPVPEGAGA